MYIFNVSVSLFCGYPKSKTSIGVPKKQRSALLQVAFSLSVLHCIMEILTIQKLVEQHKVILDTFFVKFAKVAPSNLNDAVAEFKDESCIGVALCHCNHVEVLMTDVEERGATQGDDR
jgi:hypothetical protein